MQVCKHITLFIDNKSIIDLAKNLMLHGRGKHIKRDFTLPERSEQGGAEGYPLSNRRTTS